MQPNRAKVFGQNWICKISQKIFIFKNNYEARLTLKTYQYQSHFWEIPFSFFIRYIVFTCRVVLKMGDGFHPCTKDILRCVKLVDVRWCYPIHPIALKTEIRIRQSRKPVNFTSVRWQSITSKKWREGRKVLGKI